MNVNHFLDLINTRELKVGVVGLGYVGLPVSVLVAKAGFDVVGLDIDAARVEKINSGISPIEGKEPGLGELVAEVTQRRMRATTDATSMADRDLIIIAVDTPVDDSTRIPEYRALRSVLQSVGPILKEGVLVIVESTIAPGTIKDVVVPILEERSGRKLNQGFYTGHCPERVTPGKLLYNLENYARVVGGSTPEVAEVMKAFYATYVKGELDTADVATAEMVKTTENYYRDAQIAFANQLALNCEFHGVDFYQVRELVNKVEQRNLHLPGAGVGGHCIPKDGLLNVAYYRNAYGNDSLPVQFAELSRTVNDFMPKHMADLLKGGLDEAGVLIEEGRVVILGYAFLPNSDDTRNSPSEQLVRYIKDTVAELRIHDPYVEGYKSDVSTMANSADALMIMVAHDEYKDLSIDKLSRIMRTKVIIDGRNVISKEDAIAKGFVYKGVGNV